MRGAVTLTVDGKPLALATTERRVELPPRRGQACPRCAWCSTSRPALPAASGALYYHDAYHAERPGWRESSPWRGPPLR